MPAYPYVSRDVVALPAPSLALHLMPAPLAVFRAVPASEARVLADADELG